MNSSWTRKVSRECHEFGLPNGRPSSKSANRHRLAEVEPTNVGRSQAIHPTDAVHRRQDASSAHSNENLPRRPWREKERQAERESHLRQRLFAWASERASQPARDDSQRAAAGGGLPIERERERKTE